MIELTNSVAQTIAPGAAVTFNTVLKHTGCAEFYNSRIPNSVKLTGQGGLYRVEFSGNVSGDAADTSVQLAISQGPVALPETVMESTPAVANLFNNISTSTYVANDCCDFNRIAVVNTGTVPVLLSANMKLAIMRVG